MESVHVRPAEAADDPSLARLFALYHDAYTHELGAQDVTGEGRRAREYYADGMVLVAVAEGGRENARSPERGGKVIGCVCLEPWGEGRCRMKRMVVEPDARGAGVGRRLGIALMAEAKARGYRQMCLDTTRPMAAATALYRALGFTEWDPDYEAPCNDVFYMRRSL